MNEASLEKRFIGQARLIRLLLWKIGDTTNIQTGLQVAEEKGMIDHADTSFLLACMRSEEKWRNEGVIERDIDRQTVNRLQRCADKLNRADSA